MADKVCRTCKIFVKSNVCPICGQSNFSRTWKGIIYVINPNESEVAQILGITMPGKYCLWCK